jgi:hypothetical protein
VLLGKSQGLSALPRPGTAEQENQLFRQLANSRIDHPVDRPDVQVASHAISEAISAIAGEFTARARLASMVMRARLATSDGAT